MRSCRIGEGNLLRLTYFVEVFLESSGFRIEELARLRMAVKHQDLEWCHHSVSEYGTDLPSLKLSLVTVRGRKPLLKILYHATQLYHLKFDSPSRPQWVTQIMSRLQLTL